MFQGVEAIPAREVGYILRSLGQNPTEDEINNLICEAGCDWEVRSVNRRIFDIQWNLHGDKLNPTNIILKAFDRPGVSLTDV